LSYQKLYLVVCLMATFVSLGAAQTHSALSDTSAQMSDSSWQCAQQFNQTPSLTGHYIKLLILTFALLVIFYFALRLMRKFQYGNNPHKKEQILVLSKNYLTSKHSLWIVAINGTKYLLGVTDHAINLVDKLGPVSEQELQSGIPSSLPAFGNFLEKLRKGK